MEIFLKKMVKFKKEKLDELDTKTLEKYVEQTGVSVNNEDFLKCKKYGEEGLRLLFYYMINFDKNKEEQVIELNALKDKPIITLKNDTYEKRKVVSATPEQDEINIIWDKDLKDYVQEEKEWIVEKIIPTKSVCILTGKRGTMKTFMALLIGYSISTGSNFLQKLECKKGSVIYLDKENGIGIMKRRTNLLKKGMDLDENCEIGFICFSQLKIDKYKDIQKIEEIIKKHNPTLLIIDTLRRSISFDENDAGEVSKLFVDTLRPLVEKYDLSILLIHHDRKSAGTMPDEMDEMRGSSDLANYADMILKMERKKGNVILKQLKNRNAPEEEPVKIECESCEEYIKFGYGGMVEAQTLPEKCAEILTLWFVNETIEQFKTSDAKKIAFKKGVKETNFKYALNLLQDAGIIKNIGFGLYKVETTKL